MHCHDGFVVFAHHTVSLLSDIPSGVRVPPVANLENIPFQNSWPLSAQDLLLFLLLQLTLKFWCLARATCLRMIDLS